MVIKFKRTTQAQLAKRKDIHQETVTKDNTVGGVVKLLLLPQPPLCARTDSQTNPSAQRATQLRSVLARVYDVAKQNHITTNIP
jgi:hypothetical protein